MKGISIEERAIKLAQYILDTGDTVRGAAKKFGVSKSTVHKDVSQRLIKINYPLAMEVRKVLNKNKAERHIRGGMATKLKYIHDKEKKAKWEQKQILLQKWNKLVIEMIKSTNICLKTLKIPHYIKLTQSYTFWLLGTPVI